MDRYKITIEFIPDFGTDPDAFRLHRTTVHELQVTKWVVELVREFERSLYAAKEAENERDKE